jgi:hypothetical protein
MHQPIQCNTIPNSIGRRLPVRRGLPHKERLPRTQAMWIIRGLLLIPLLLACFALSQTAQAVSPPPDGGYPGNNTAEGTNALLNLTSGANNTAVGTNALLHDTSGGYNVGVGSQALALNSTGNFNMAIGTQALYNNTASANMAVGFRVLFNNTTGSDLTGIGTGALFMNTTGNENTAIGSGALNSNTTGASNTAVGRQALQFNTTGSYNTASGDGALYSNTIGNQSTAVGYQALYSSTGPGNPGNTATGYEALFHNTTGFANTANGVSALFVNNTGNLNTAIGYDALVANGSGSNNIALGVNAGSNLSSGDNNIYIGSLGVATESDTIRIGTSGVQTRAFIRGIRGVTTDNNNAIPVLIDSAGQLGTVSSSRRYKKEIKAMEQASAAILSLKPVTFHYKSDNTSAPQFGLIAEEVAEVNPDLVVRDENGEIYTVRYDAVNAMLLNEFLKEHRKVEQQEAGIAVLKSTVAQQQKDSNAAAAQQQKEIRALTANLKEQTAQIQKVSAQLELNKPAPRTVADK